MDIKLVLLFRVEVDAFGEIRVANVIPHHPSVINNGYIKLRYASG